jgi:hypothetical protein
MKLIKGLLLFSVILVSAVSCFDPPEFSNVPKIFLEDLYYLPRNNSESQSLVIALRFQDGDGDLGLEDKDSDEPFHSTNILAFRSANDSTTIPLYFVDNKRFAIPNSSINGTIATEKLRTEPDFSFIPENRFPIRCTRFLFDSIYFPASFAHLIPDNYTTKRETISGLEWIQVKETFFVSPNPNTFNIFIDLLRYNSVIDDFEVIDFVSLNPDCGAPFTGRFPRLSTEAGDLEGVIKYSMKSEVLDIGFGTSRLKLRVYIQDRALNKSNVIVTKEFTLSEILRKT